MTTAVAEATKNVGTTTTEPLFKQPPGLLRLLPVGSELTKHHNNVPPMPVVFLCWSKQTTR